MSETQDKSQLAHDALRAMLRGFQVEAELILDEMSRVDLEHLADCAGELSELAELAARRKRDRRRSEVSR